MELDVQKVAALAKLHVPEDRLAPLGRDMAAILAMVGGLPPADNIPDEPQNLPTMPLREDVIRPSTPRGALLKNAPATDSEYVKVPRVLE